MIRDRANAIAFGDGGKQNLQVVFVFHKSGGVRTDGGLLVRRSAKRAVFFVAVDFFTPHIRIFLQGCWIQAHIVDFFCALSAPLRHRFGGADRFACRNGVSDRTRQRGDKRVLKSSDKPFNLAFLLRRIRQSELLDDAACFQRRCEMMSCKLLSIVGFHGGGQAPFPNGAAQKAERCDLIGLLTNFDHRAARIRIDKGDDFVSFCHARSQNKHIGGRCVDLPKLVDCLDARIVFANGGRKTRFGIRAIVRAKDVA